MGDLIGDVVGFLAVEGATHQVVDADLLSFGIADDNALVASGDSCRGGFLYRVNGIGLVVAFKIGRIDDIVGHLDCSVGVGGIIAPADEMIASFGCCAEGGKVVLASGVLCDFDCALVFVDTFND